MEKRLELTISADGAKKGASEAVKYANDVSDAGDKASGAFERLTQQLNGFGSAFSSFDNNLKNSSFAAFQQNLMASANSMKDFVESVDRGLSSFTNLQNKFQETTTASATLRDSLKTSNTAIKTFVETVSDSSDRASNSFLNLNDRAKTLSTGFTAVNKNAGALGTRLGNLDSHTKDFRDTIKSANPNLVKFSSGVEKAALSSLDADYAFREARDGAKTLGVNLNTLGSKSDKTSKSMNFFRDRLVAVNKEFTPLKNNAGKIAEQLGRTNDKTKELGTSFASLSRTMKDAAKGLNLATQRLESMDKKLRATEKRLQNTRRSVDSLTNGLGSLSSAIAGVGFGMAAREAALFLDTYTNLQNKIAVVSGETTNLERATRELLDVSVASRSDLEGTVDVYSKLVRINGEYGRSQEELLSITESVSKSVAMSGASVQGAQGAMLQFSQALGSNFSASAQELNSIIEQTPALAQSLAKALTATGQLGNVTMSSLKALAKEGLITTDLVLEGFLKIRDVIDEDFNKATRTISQSFVALTDTIRVSLGELDKASSISKTFSENVLDLTNYLKDNKDVLAGWVAGLTAFGITAGALVVAGAVVFAPIVAGIAAVATASGLAAGALVQARTKLDEVAASAKILNEEIAGVKGVMSDLASSGQVNSIDAVSEAIDKQKESLSIISEKGEIFRDALQSIEEQGVRYNGVIIENAEQNRRLGMSYLQIKKSVETLSEAENTLRDDIERLTDTYSDLLLPMNAINAARNISQQKIASATKSVNEFIAATRLEIEAENMSAEAKFKHEFMTNALNIAKKELGVVTSDLAIRIIDEANALWKYNELLGKNSKTTITNTKTKLKSYKDILSQFKPLVKIELDYEDLVQDINKSTSTRIQKEELLTLALDKKNKEILELTKNEVTAKSITDSVINNLGLETSALRLSERQLKEREVLTNAINQATSAGVELSQDNIKAILAEADAYSTMQETLESVNKNLEERKDLSENIASTFMDGFEAAMDGMTSFREFFKETLKQMALDALKNKIVIPIANSLSGLNIAGTALSSGGGLFGGGNLLSSASSLLTGGLSPSAMLQGFNFFASGGASAQQAAMLAAQTGGDATFGALTSEALGTPNAGLFSNLTSSIVSGVGSIMTTAIPALLATSIIGDIFEGSPATMTFAQAASGQEGVSFDVTQSDKGWGVAGDMATGEDVTRTFEEQFGAWIETAFGRFGTLDNSFSKKVDEEFLGTIFNFVSLLDESIAEAVGEDTTKLIADTLTTRFLPEGSYAGRVDGRNEGETPEEQLINRYSQILGQIIPQEFVDRLTSVKDLNLETFAADVISSIYVVEGAVESLGVVADDLVAIADNNKEGNENFIETLRRINMEVVVVTSAFDTLGQNMNLTGQDMIDAGKNIIRGAGDLSRFTAASTTYENGFVNNTAGLQFLQQVEIISRQFADLGYALPTTKDSFTELLDSLDLTTEAGQIAYGQLMVLSEGVLTFTNSLESMYEGLQPLTNLSQKIREDLMSDKDLYTFRKGQAEALSDTISTMTDPSAILAATDKIESIVSNMWGSLDDFQRNRLGEDFITYLDDVAQIARDRLTELTTGSVQEGVQASQASDEKIAQLNIQAAENMKAAATDLSTAASALVGAANVISAATSAMAASNVNKGGTDNVFSR